MRRGEARAKLAGQGFFAKTMTRARRSDGGEADRTRADRVFGGCLYICATPFFATNFL
ncbi:MAG: hypothetical protein LBB09_00470 [Rickettsiales bacterium]|jgi:hypothetical protein|nr:hypothetical protein [Rickettsiales bacterium]